MTTAIQVVWWIGLVGALLATVVILKQVSVVLRTLQHIHELAERTRHASEGLAEAIAAAPRIQGLRDPAMRFDAATESVATAADALSRRLDRVLLGPQPPD